MNKTLTKVALRYKALYIDINRKDIDMRSETSIPIMAFIAELKELGYCVSEELLHALNLVNDNALQEITDCINEILQTDLNWAPLVKAWDIPTGEKRENHLLTFIANIFGDLQQKLKGTSLPCGHFIPKDLFQLERYNGCPFCGTPFETADFVYKGQASKLKELRLFTADDIQHLFDSLLTSATPLDGTQKDTLQQLLGVYPVPEDIGIKMKETAIIVARTLIELGKNEQASRFMKTPKDILRYLWYEKTGCVQIIEPKTLIRHARKLSYRLEWKGRLDNMKEAENNMKQALRLKYDRKMCLRVACWLNAIPMNAAEAAEEMNSKRGMWVRMIRALRLGEYSRRKGMEHLAEILDRFYKHSYFTWQGNIDRFCLIGDCTMTLKLLRQRPGIFARSLFAAMLRFGSDKTLAEFDKIADKLPSRLLLSLVNAAEIYFDPDSKRIVRTIMGETKQIEHNKLMSCYDNEALQEMTEEIKDIYTGSMHRRFASQNTNNKTIYIDPVLYDIPIGVGDRSATIQDASCALTGTRFAVEGDKVRLFLQWGKGLPAQHLDMDLSCVTAFADGRAEYCYFGNLTCTGAKHSGDIRSIPPMVGTAEYIELSLSELEVANARYVTFSCNAYSRGSLSPNLVVGWMSSEKPMQISKRTGVAYDPSCVQQMIRISENNLSKGLIFGVLDVPKREITWLEMPFISQVIHAADMTSVEALLRKLAAKVSVGELLKLKAKAQKLIPIATASEANEAYTYEWAITPGNINSLLNI